jgi:acetyl esterase/lipase
MPDTNPNLPGRLGNSQATLLEDVRLDPRIKAAMELAGVLGDQVEPISADASLEECYDYCLTFEAASAITHPAQLEMMPDYGDVEQTTEVIKGVDGNDITLYIHKPKNKTGPLPCIVHTHGGGMVLMTAEDPGFIRWRNTLAQMGMVVVGVEFRNGAGRLGNHPFPAGLNDCASAAKWTHENRSALGISSIVISGESGGGNLSIATTLKAKQEGWLDAIDGVYACCPYISGAYANPPAQLLSLTENNEYMLDCNQMSIMVRVYDPELQNSSNPLAWPMQASIESLAGLPPHVVSVNELDPLRDEGLVFARKLLAAGVSVVTKTVNGTPHAGDLMMPDVVPDVYAETARSVLGFAESLV